MGNVFGPPYPKINTCYKRDDRGRIVVGEWSLPEFEYLANLPWSWTEKVDGTNIRVHWNGGDVTVGGRTDAAQVPATLISALGFLNDPAKWRTTFPDGETTVYGEGYGAKIQSGGQYRQDQALIVFDVRVGEWWLHPDDVRDVAGKLGLDTVPEQDYCTLQSACERLSCDRYTSFWPGARIEGLVGRPAVDLYDRRGERILTKLKVKDWKALERK